MHRQFNMKQFHVLPTQFIYVFYVNLRRNSYYRIFSNLIRTSFCRFLNRKKKKKKSAPFLQPPLAYKAD